MRPGNLSKFQPTNYPYNRTIKDGLNLMNIENGKSLIIRRGMRQC